MEDPTLPVSDSTKEKCINTKIRNSLGDKVKGTLTEVKMSRMDKKSELDQQKKTYHRDETPYVMCFLQST